MNIQSYFSSSSLTLFAIVAVGIANILGFPFAAANSIPTPRESLDIETPLDLSGTPAKPVFKAQSAEKKSRFLSKKAVAILQHWYQKHRDHPYASDDEVKELAAAGAITPNQVIFLANCCDKLLHGCFFGTNNF